MSGRPAKLRIDLTAGELADLNAIARSLKRTVPALVAEIVAEWIGPRLAAPVPADALDAARKRLATLHAWRAAGRPDDGQDGVSRATLYRWELIWQGKGLGGLVDGRAVAERPPRTRYRDFVGELRRVVASRKRGVTAGLSAAYRQARERAVLEGWAVPSLRTASRIIGGAAAAFGRQSNKVRPTLKSSSNPTRVRPSGRTASKPGRRGARSATRA